MGGGLAVLAGRSQATYQLIAGFETDDVTFRGAPLVIHVHGLLTRSGAAYGVRRGCRGDGVGRGVSRGLVHAGVVDLVVRCAEIVDKLIGRIQLFHDLMG
jgi:hypothetical protein